MKLIAVVVLAAMLSACTSAAQEAEQRYDIVAKAGSSSDRCREADRVAQAWLSEGNQDKYAFWKMMRDADCVGASLGLK